jgi:hypothetical protein
VQDGADGSGGGVFARLYSKDGGPLGTEMALNTYTTGSQLRPAITFVDADTVVVAWSSEAQDGSEEAIVARRFTRSAPACGDATADGVTTAADALAALRAATGAEACAACLCDCDTSGMTTASDALRILSVATVCRSPSRAITAEASRSEAQASPGSRFRLSSLSTNRESWSRNWRRTIPAAALSPDSLAHTGCHDGSPIDASKRVPLKVPQSRTAPEFTKAATQPTTSSSLRACADRALTSSSIVVSRGMGVVILSRKTTCSVA